MQDIALLSISQIGIMNSIFGVAMMTVMIPAGWLADKVGERVNIAVSFLFISFSIAMIALVPPGSSAMDICCWLGDCRYWRWISDTSLPIIDQQSSPGALAWGGIRFVQHQSGISIPASPGDW